MSDGIKFSEGKPRWSLLPWAEVGQIVEVLTYGAEKKYDDFNWKKVKNLEEEYFSALHRHLKAYACGEKIDPGSGKPHLAHAACNLLFLMWGENNPDWTGDK